MEEAAEGLLGRAALSAGDGTAQLSEAGLELNTSALQSLATSLTSLGTLIKIPPPVRLLHFFWHLKIWKSHRDNWRCPGDVEQVLCRGTGLCQGQLWNVSHICIPAWDSNSSSSQWPAGLTGLAFCCWIARMASWFAPLFLETSLGDVVSFGRQKLFLLVLK